MPVESTLRLVVTGTRTSERTDVWHWLDRWVRRYGAPELVILGDCPTGVDRQARAWCEAHGHRYMIKYVNKAHPSPMRFHLRNQCMVDAARTGDHCVGFPGEGSRGTYDTVHRARKAGLLTFLPPFHQAA